MKHACCIALLLFCIDYKGDRVAELILNHARANECQDVPRFKKEMAELVNLAVSDTLSLGKVQHRPATQKTQPSDISG